MGWRRAVLLFHGMCSSGRASPHSKARPRTHGASPKLLRVLGIGCGPPLRWRPGVILSGCPSPSAPPPMVTPYPMVGAHRGWTRTLDGSTRIPARPHLRCWILVSPGSSVTFLVHCGGDWPSASPADRYQTPSGSSLNPASAVPKWHGPPGPAIDTLRVVLLETLLRAHGLVGLYACSC